MNKNKIILTGLFLMCSVGYSLVLHAELLTSTKGLRYSHPTFLSEKIEPSAKYTTPPEESKLSKMIVEDQQFSGKIFDVMRILFENKNFTIVENEELADLNVNIDSKGQSVAFLVHLIAITLNIDYSIDWKNRVLMFFPIKPVLKMYKVDTLPFLRSYSEKTSSTSGSNGSAGGVSTSSPKSLDKWEEIRESVQLILANDINSAVIKKDVSGLNIPRTPSFSISKTSGILMVNATPKTHKLIKKYLNGLSWAMNSEIVVEVNIIEITDTSTTQSGINWQRIGQSLVNNNLPYSTRNSFGFGMNGNSIINAATTGIFSLNFARGSFSAVLTALEKEGPSKVVSQPVIMTINNQTGIIKIGATGSYVTGIQINTTITNGVSSDRITPTFEEIFSGLSLAVTPSISRDGTILLQVKPSISSVLEVNKIVSGVTYPTAVRKVREQDIIVKTTNGGIVAIGGLTSLSASRTMSGVPVLDDIPVLGGLFKNRSSLRKKTEIIMLLRATIIDPLKDQELAKRYMRKMKRNQLMNPDFYSTQTKNNDIKTSVEIEKVRKKIIIANSDLIVLGQKIKVLSARSATLASGKNKMSASLFNFNISKLSTQIRNMSKEILEKRYIKASLQAQMSDLLKDR